jgi:hypothetical protein
MRPSFLCLLTSQIIDRQNCHDFFPARRQCVTVHRSLPLTPPPTPDLVRGEGQEDGGGSLTTVWMGISFKLSKVGVRVHPAARSASAAVAEKPGAGGKEGSLSESTREVRRSWLLSLACLVCVSLRDGLGANSGGGSRSGKQFVEELMKNLTSIFFVFRRISLIRYKD